jgi:hypothetical protein
MSYVTAWVAGWHFLCVNFAPRNASKPSLNCPLLMLYVHQIWKFSTRFEDLPSKKFNENLFRSCGAVTSTDR